MRGVCVLTRACKSCGEEKKFLFDNGRCPPCEAAADRDKQMDSVLEKLGFQSESNPICHKCQKAKPLDLFIPESGGRSLLCKTCQLVAGYRIAEDNRERLAEEAWRKKLNSIPLGGFEESKIEKYHIRCVRCKKPRDPLQVKVVAALCEYCWEPGQETEDCLALHKAWMNEGPKQGRFRRENNNYS